MNLICRDEEQVIERCIRSTMPVIDSWCIVDTGSTDRTKEIIRDVLRGLPGKLYSQPWRDFGFNKTAAIKRARNHAHYALLLDADDVIEVEGEASPRLSLKADCYDLRVFYNNLEYDRPHVVKTDLDFHYVGVRHEYLTCRGDFTKGGRIEGLRYRVVGGGARSRDPKKFLHDAEALIEDLKRDPHNGRTLYYIGQSYRDAGDREMAREWFVKRGAMPGWPEETFMALFEAAKCVELTGKSADEVTCAYLRAWESRPERAEPLYELARYLRTHGDRFRAAYEFARIACTIPRPDDKLFVDMDVYRWRAADEMAIAAFYVDKKDEGAAICERILKEDLPESDRKRVEKNLAWCRGETPPADEEEESGGDEAPGDGGDPGEEQGAHAP